MAIVVEDGTGKDNAESYASVADADAYHSSRGNAAWAALSTPVKEENLRKATDYLAAYDAVWKGSRVSSSQALAWPRRGVDAHNFEILSTVVPKAVTVATAILALKASAGELAPDLDRGVLREKVGVLETEYDPASPQARRYVEVDRLLAPYLCGRSYSVPLRRS
jgi:hypothetical protein